jgi:hypothetical protein
MDEWCLMVCFNHISTKNLRPNLFETEIFIPANTFFHIITGYIWLQSQGASRTFFSTHLLYNPKDFSVELLSGFITKNSPAAARMICGHKIISLPHAKVKQEGSLTTLFNHYCC